MSSRISVHHSATWAGLTQVAKIVTQLIGLLVLARLLQPADYGLMAIAAAITTFATLFRDMGTSASIIQKSTLNTMLASTVFWLNACLGATITIILVALSSFMGVIFAQAQLPNVLLVLSPVFIVMAAGSVHQAFLERESNFKVIAGIELTSACIALLVAVTTAMAGAGVYALVMQSLTAAIVSTVMLWTIKRWRPSFIFDPQSIREIWAFSGNLFLFNVTNYFQRNADTAAIGRFLGSADLGLYNVAYRILLFPLQNITFVIARVSFPAYSRYQHDKPELAKHYLQTLQNVAFITAPTMTAIWLSREPFIDALFGPKWQPAAEVLFWLAPVGFLQSMVSTSGSLLSAIGRTSVLRNIGFFSLFFLVVPLLAGLPWGIQGVAAGYCMGNIVWTYPVLQKTLKQLDRNYFDFVRSIYRPLLIALLSGIATYVVTLAWKQVAMPSLARTVVDSCVYLTFYMLAILIFYPKLWRQFKCDVTGKPMPVHSPLE